ncbi:class I SAM-dependent methyltransferase [Selenomonas sp.]|uniref:class I SAM-dependent methyltransferase n=1 Tax=Selenomonas sp. TaxID=2053611 RepID=UPI0025ED2EB6|nr:class I SAM-dependent methyltransferase [Selenomonas sp.]
MRHTLMDFIAGGPEAGRWLVVESAQYLKPLRAAYPNAAITAVTRFEEIAELAEFRELDIAWHILDYRREELPFAEESFDYAVAESCLEEAFQPYESMMDISRKLTDVGVLYTSYGNIRYHGVLAQLREGIFPVRQQHLYAKSEVVRLLDDTLYKEIDFLPGQQDDDFSAGDAWEAQGFDNFSHDLSTSCWLVEAKRSTAAVANLKSLYDKETRKQLARLIHRIEYDVEAEKNLAELKRFCEENMIFDEYLADFIQEICVRPLKLTEYLART